MADENATSPQADSAPAESTKADEVAQPVVGEVAASVASDVTQPVAKEEVVTTAPESAAKAVPHAAEIQSHQAYHSQHHHFKWHADILVDGHDVYQGFVKDITMEGVHLFLEHNLQNSKFVKLHIHIPPLANTSPHSVIEVTGKIMSTIYDSSEDFFRSAIHFLEFTRESDKSYLQARLYD